MSLPILQTSSNPTPATLVRLFHQTELQWARLTSDEQLLDVGLALFNPRLQRVWDANRILDAALPAGVSASEAVSAAEQFYRVKGTRLWRWVLNPSVNGRETASYLLSAGYRKEFFDILRLEHRRTLSEVPGLKIIPARASFRHARELAEEAAAGCNEPQIADAGVLRIDDPHVDALIALKDGRAVAGVAVLAVGEIGRIDGVFVSDRFRGGGVGRTMMSRALEICARSLFKHVMLSVDPSNAAAQSLYRSLGFEKIGVIEMFMATGVG